MNHIEYIYKNIKTELAELSLDQFYQFRYDTKDETCTISYKENPALKFEFSMEKNKTIFVYCPDILVHRFENMNYLFHKSKDFILWVNEFIESFKLEYHLKIVQVNNYLFEKFQCLNDKIPAKNILNKLGFLYLSEESGLKIIPSIEIKNTLALVSTFSRKEKELEQIVRFEYLVEHGFLRLRFIIPDKREKQIYPNLDFNIDDVYDYSESALKYEEYIINNAEIWFKKNSLIKAKKILSTNFVDNKTLSEFEKERFKRYFDEIKAT